MYFCIKFCFPTISREMFLVLLVIDNSEFAGKDLIVGDNSEPSIDSRSWGFLTRKEIIGKYLFRYWKRR